MAIKVHHLRPAPGAKTPKTRVGRGEGSKGKTAGRGTKGTKARYQVPASFEGGQMPIHMRLPKLKGFRNRFRVEFQVVNLERLVELFPQGGEVGPVELVKASTIGGTANVLSDVDIFSSGGTSVASHRTLVDLPTVPVPSAAPLVLTGTAVTPAGTVPPNVQNV